MKKSPPPPRAAKLSETPSKFSPLWQRLVLILICVACYGNTLVNKYSLDDDFAVFENPYIQKGVAGIPEILTNPYFSDKTKQMDYRPVPGVLFAIEYQFFGNNPHVNHFVSTLLFVLLALTIYWALTEVFQLNRIHFLLPFIITTVYIVHPSHTEAVASIKNRDEILSFLFALLAVIFSHRFLSFPEKRIKMAVLAILFMMISLLCKLIALPVLGVIFLYGYFHGLRYQHNRAFYIFFACLFIITFSAVVSITSSVKREMYDLENPLVGNTNFSENAGTILETLFFYFKFMLWPYPSRFFYGYNQIPVITFGNPIAAVSFIVHLAALIAGIVFFRRKKLVGFFILSYLLNIVFYSNIIRYPGIVSERILFIPSLWFIAALVLLVFRWCQFDRAKKSLSAFQKFAVVLAILVGITYAGLTIKRNSQWRDRLSLMEADMPHLKNSALANYFYAGALMAERKATNRPQQKEEYLSKAKKHYKRTLQIAPVYPDAFFALGMIYEYQDPNRDSAFYYFSNAYKYDSLNTRTKFQLGKQYFYKQDSEEKMKQNAVRAEQLFGDVYKALPADTFTIYFYAQALYHAGKTEKAFEINDMLLKLAPNTPYPYDNLGAFYAGKGDFANAAVNYEKALRLGMRNQDIYNALLNYYLETGQNAKIEELQKIY